MYEFFCEYLGFFEQMHESEKHKLNALLTKNIKELNRIIAAKQAEALKLEALEKRREAVLAENGFGGMTFSQIIEKLAPEDKKRFSEIFEKLGKLVTDIKFLNEKSMNITRDNLKDMPSSKEGTSYGRGYSEPGDNGTVIINAKI